MKTKSVEVCDAIHIDILCAYNDWADIKCGGSPTLGYDFIISPDENVEEMIKFIKGCLKKYGRPFEGSSHHISKDFKVKNLWTKTKIENCIKTYAVC
jgi:hypothetical protein